MPDLATGIATTVENLTRSTSRGGNFNGVYAENQRVLAQAANAASRATSSTEALNTAMLRRASLLERMALASERGNEKELYLAQKQLADMEEKLKIMRTVNEMEKKREALIKKRRMYEDYETKHAKTGMQVSKKMLEQHKQLNEELALMGTEYNTHVKVLQKVMDGVTDVKSAQEQVTKEIEAQNEAYERSAKSAAQLRLEEVAARRAQLKDDMTHVFGEGFGKFKDDMKGKIATFTSLGAAAGLLGSAFKDMNHDSEEVVSSLYRMGGNLDKVSNKFGYYVGSVIKLNQVQTNLKMTAAEMNLPVEAVNGMTDAIMEQIRIYDKAGRIDTKMIENIAKTGLAYSRLTMTDAKESIALMSTMNNKLGYSTTKQVRAGVTELDDQMQGIVAAVTTANDKLESLGDGKANIFIEDVAKMMNEAASSTDGFSLSLKGLALNVTKQMQDAKHLGATYNEALAQAKTMTDFLTKRNDLVNFKVGNNLMAQMRQRHGDLIANKDVAGLTAAIQSEYGVKSANEANAVARGVISGHGPAALMTGKLLGSTEAGQAASLDVIASAIREKMKALPEGQVLQATDLANVAGTMGVDVMSDAGMGLMNTFINQAEEAKKNGKLDTNFLAGEKGDEYRKSLKNAQADSVTKNSPVTPTSIKESIAAIVESPFNKMILGIGALGVAVGINATLLSGILANTTVMAAAAGSGLAKSVLGGIGANGGGLGGVLKGGGKFLLRSKWGKGAAAIAGLAALGYGAYKVHHHYSKDGQAEDKVEKEQEDAQKARDREGLKATLSDPDASKEDKKDAALKLAELGPEPTENANVSSTVTVAPKTPVTPTTTTTPATVGETMVANPAAEVVKDLAGDRSLAGQATDGVIGMGFNVAKAGGMAMLGKGSFKVGEQILGTGGAPAVSALLKGAGLKGAAKAGVSGAAKAGLNGIPFLGGLISSGITMATTEGSWGRKISAGVGNLVGSELGSFLGPLGGIAGGFAGEKGGTALYDSIWGDEPKKPLATPATVPAMAQPQTQAQREQTPPGFNGVAGNYAQTTALPGQITRIGSNVAFLFPMMQYQKVTQQTLNKIASTETGLSGL